jgi:hypothetical protein
MNTTSLLKPMSNFDPSEPALVHDRRNNRTLPWSPEFKRSFEKYGRENEPGVIDYDGLELDGWMDIDEGFKPN